MSTKARRIVVGYDDSDAAGRALDRAAALAGYGSSLTVVNVVPHSAEHGDVLDHAREHLLGRLVDASYVRAVGDPAAGLVETARALEADLVVVGRREGHVFRRLVLGSVSAKVVRGAPCDVLVVR